MLKLAYISNIKPMVASQKDPQKSKTDFIKLFPIYEPLDRRSIPAHT